MWLFLVTEFMFFGGLFLAYLVYRYWYPQQFAAGSHHTIGLTSAGSVLASGDNEHGQCDFYRLIEKDDAKHVDWRKKLGGMLLREVGLTVTWQEEWSASHHATAAALLQCFRADASNIARHIGPLALAELTAAHELWSDWLGCGRVRKFALVA